MYMFMPHQLEQFQKAALAIVFAFALAAPFYSLPVSAQFTAGGGQEIEDEVEEQVEEQVEEEVIDNAEESVEDELTFGGLPNPVEDEVEEQVEEQVEGQLEEEVAEVTEDSVEQSVTEDSESAIEQGVEEATEQQVVDVTEESVEDEVEADVEDSVVAAAEGTVEEGVEEEVDAAATDVVEETVADTAESTVEEQVAESVDESVEESTEEQVAESVDESVEESTEEQVAESVDDTAEDLVAEFVDQSITGSTEEQIVDIAEGRLEAKVDELIDDIEYGIDIDERRIHRDQWLVMAEPQVFDELAEEGYIFDQFTELPGLGLRLAEVAAPASFDISSARNGIMDVVGSDRAEVDLNHIYTAGAPETESFEAGIAPSEAMAFPGDLGAMDLRIGIVDSDVDISHPAFASAQISTRPFADAPDLPNFHGTAIASIIASDTDQLHGLAPRAEIFAAAVFERDEARGEIASTVSLVKALDWLLSSNVDAVNLSLAGPPNRLLEVALKRVVDQGVMVLAAAGNGGPMARPQYPAAYNTVVAVTAVDQGGKAFRMANRGDYLDLAAPGVNLRHAVAGGGYASSSGTSFAVPFAVTAAAVLKHREPGTDVIARLYAAATDIGPPGRDDIYGYGLLTL